jgi:hypothetical protein
VTVPTIGPDLNGTLTQCAVQHDAGPDRKRRQRADIITSSLRFIATGAQWTTPKIQPWKASAKSVMTRATPASAITISIIQGVSGASS